MTSIDQWQPGDRPGAPAPLAALQAFLNTVNLELGYEELADGAAAADWLARHGLADDDPRALTGAELGRLLGARRGLRRAVAAGGLDDGTRAALRAEGVLVTATPGGDGPAIVAVGATSVDTAVARLMLVMAASVADGTWPRLKMCLRASCQWVFYDRSRNRSGHWCSSRVCGMRTNVENYRRRRRAEGSGPA